MSKNSRRGFELTWRTDANIKSEANLFSCLLDTKRFQIWTEVSQKAFFCFHHRTRPSPASTYESMLRSEEGSGAENQKAPFLKELRAAAVFSRRPSQWLILAGAEPALPSHGQHSSRTPICVPAAGVPRSTQSLRIGSLSPHFWALSGRVFSTRSPG